MADLLNRTKEMRVTLVVAMVIILMFYALFKLVAYWFPATGEEVAEVYFADSISPFHLEIIKEFNAEYEGRIRVIPVDIGFQYLTTNERKQLFTRYLRSENKRIDIFSIDQIWIPRFSKWCEPLNTYIDAALKKNIISSALISAEYNGTFVAIPQFTDLSMLYYREDLVKSIPELKSISSSDFSITWEQIIKSSQFFKPGNTLVFQGASYEGLVCMFTEIYLGLGGKYNREDILPFEREKTIKAVKWLKDIIVDNKIAPRGVTSMVENSSYAAFVDNNIPFMRNWSNVGSDVYADNASMSKISRTKVALLPRFENGNQVTLLGGWYMMVSKFSDRKKEAFEFIKYWLRKSSQKKMFVTGGFVPVNVNAYNDSAFTAKYPVLKFYKRAIESAVTRPFIPDYTKISDIMSENINKALKNEISAEEAVDRMFSSVRKSGPEIR